MFQRWIVLSLTLLACTFSTIGSKAFAHERPYEFDGTHFALSIERFMGIDYTDFEGPGGDKVTGRFLVNADEGVPTNVARFGFDVFLHRFSIGIAGGATTGNVAIIAPRVGYLFGLTPQLGLWLRAGGFYSKWGDIEYAGLTGEVLFGWFPYNNIAITFGPTFDAAFADDPNPNYISIGIPQFGLTAFL